MLIYIYADIPDTIFTFSTVDCKQGTPVIITFEMKESWNIIRNGLFISTFMGYFVAMRGEIH